MRHISGIRRAVAAAVVVAAAATSCTVQPSDGTGNGAGKQQPDAKPSATAPDGKPSKSPSSKPDAQEALLSPGDEGKQVRELQARLRQIAWYFQYPNGKYDAATVKAVKGFQEKRGLAKTGDTDPVTMKKLVGMTSKPGYFELYAGGDQPPAKPDKRCLTGRVLCISKSSRTLSWMIDGKVVSTVDVRFGSQYTPTREGVFSVYWKSRHHVSTLYDTPMPYAMFFSGGQAVHYSSDFAARGYGGASHGCVNVRNEGKIAALFGQVQKGDKVVIYW